jgi:low affinity Fe/Cu permease
MAMSRLFSSAAHWIAAKCGHAAVFITAVAIVVVWAATGPLFGYSDTWQLIINTGTTIITFLMVFLIQNTQNRDTAAIQLKLDELIRANQNARNAMLCLEDFTEDELKRVKTTFASMASIPEDREHMMGAVHEIKDELKATEKVLEEATARLVESGQRSG